MEQIELIKVTHANLHKTVYLAKYLIAGFYYSDAHKCTHIVASGGAIFPAAESVEEVQRLIETPTSSSKGGAI